MPLHSDGTFSFRTDHCGTERQQQHYCQSQRYPALLPESDGQVTPSEAQFSASNTATSTSHDQRLPNKPHLPKHIFLKQHCHQHPSYQHCYRQPPLNRNNAHPPQYIHNNQPCFQPSYLEDSHLLGFTPICHKLHGRSKPPRNKTLNARACGACRHHNPPRFSLHTISTHRPPPMAPSPTNQPKTKPPTPTPTPHSTTIKQVAPHQHKRSKQHRYQHQSYQHFPTNCAT